MENNYGRGAQGPATRTLEKSKSDQEHSQAFYFREIRVGSDIHSEEVSVEEAVGIIQVTDNKRHESGRSLEKGDRLKGKSERIW